jgi:hypothetical protein
VAVAPVVVVDKLEPELLEVVAVVVDKLEPE